MKSLADIFRHLVHPHELHDEAPPSQYRRDEPHHELLAQGKHRVQPSAQGGAAAQNPSEQEMRDYLASLATAFGLPADVVHAVA